MVCRRKHADSESGISKDQNAEIRSNYRKQRRRIPLNNWLRSRRRHRRFDVLSDPEKRLLIRFSKRFFAHNLLPASHTFYLFFRLNMPWKLLLITFSTGFIFFPDSAIIKWLSAQKLLSLLTTVVHNRFERAERRETLTIHFQLNLS